MPQSSSTRLPPTSTRCIDPVTDRAAPQNVTAGPADPLVQSFFMHSLYQIGARATAAGGYSFRTAAGRVPVVLARSVGVADRSARMKSGTGDHMKSHRALLWLAVALLLG